MTEYYNSEEVRKTVALLTDNSPYEVRIISNNGRVYSGYFQGAEIMLKELSKYDLAGCNVYLTLNKIHEGCYCRIQRDHFIECKGNNKNAPQTSENDIVAFRWLLVDLDPKRPSGISSSEDELKHAKQLALKVIDFMKSLGFENCIIALSGNGIHLLYRIDEDATDENKNMISDCLKAIDMNCSDEIVKIDAVNFKKNQLCKLHGTLAQKGCNTSERPFRMSRIISLEELKEGVDDE